MKRDPDWYNYDQGRWQNPKLLKGKKEYE